MENSRAYILDPINAGSRDIKLKWNGWDMMTAGVSRPPGLRLCLGLCPATVKEAMVCKVASLTAVIIQYELRWVAAALRSRRQPSQFLQSHQLVELALWLCDPTNTDLILRIQGLIEEIRLGLDIIMEVTLACQHSPHQRHIPPPIPS